MFYCIAAFTNYQKEIKIFSLSETSFITCEIFEFSCPYQKLHGHLATIELVSNNINTIRTVIYFTCDVFDDIPISIFFLFRYFFLKLLS